MDFGFRVTVKIDSKNEESKTYYIFIDRNDFYTVKDLENHIKKMFGLTRDITLFIDDCILPSNEKISVILLQDCIRVQLNDSENSKTLKDEIIKSKEQVTTSCAVKKASQVKFREKKTGPSQSKLRHLGVYPEMLWNQMLKNNVGGLPEVESEEPKEEISPLQQPVAATPEQKPLEEFKNLSSKRKRKRKHKSKGAPEELGAGAITPPASSLNLSPTIRNSTKKSCGKHEHFASDNEEELIGTKELCHEEKEMSSPSMKTVIELSSENDENYKNQSNSWQDGLLSMRITLPEEKVFYRQFNKGLPKSTAETCDDQLSMKLSKNFDPAMFPVVDNFKEKDVITFKILKMGEDDCPTVSENILASVKNIDEQSLVTLKILKGKEEFETPDVQFILDCSLDLSGEVDTVKLKQKAMIEPRLLYP